MITKHNDSIAYDGHKNFGLTKREWLAGLAMQGMLANSYQSNGAQPLSEANRHEIAQMATEQADALIRYMNDNQRDEKGKLYEKK